MNKLNEHEWMEKLEKEGFADLRVCPLPPDKDTGEHTHDVHTVHVILGGELTIIDKKGRRTFRPGDKVEFPAGTRHRAVGNPKGGSMIVGVKAENASESRHISVSIRRPAEHVYEFASNPENLTRWASGLGSVKKVNGELIAESPMGTIKIKFAGKNKFGVLDHDVTLPSGVKIHNPMRVVPNGRRSEVIFTLFRQPGMSDRKFLKDAQWVEKDLKKLKALLEKVN